MINEKEVFLESVRNAKDHKKLYHYTNFEALEKIIANKSIRLTRIDKVNDMHENARIDYIWKSKIFVACFTHRKYESYMFWKIYAKKNGLMIEFDNRILCRNNIEVYGDEKCTIPFAMYEKSDFLHKRNEDYTDWKLRDVTLGDLEYTVDFEQYCAEDEELKTFFANTVMVGKRKDFKYNLFPGLVKGIEWDNEEETRLRVGLSYKGLSNSPSSAAPVPPFEYVYIKLSDDLLSNMVITLNPWRDNSLRDSVIEGLRKYEYTNKCRVTDSTIMNQVRCSQ